ncbi:MAG TPA: hypothetical protein VGB53_07645 [Rubricoccaceae bacterium]|jgi:hypothetical protein
MTARFGLALLSALVGLAACTSPEAPAAALPGRAADSADVPVPADTPESRAEAAGLSRRQARALAALGVPVYVPTLPAGWRLLSATTDSLVDGGGAWPEVVLRYQTDRATCLAVVGASEGLGDVMVDEPPYERDVRVPGVPMHGPARLGWGIPGERAEGWEDGRVATEWFGTDVLAVRVEAAPGDDCAPASPEAAETLLASLRPLDPADDAANVGPVAFADAAEAAGEDPEAVARMAYGPAEPGEGRQETSVETLLRRPRVAVVLVTTTGGGDDSVRDERMRVVLTRGPAGWRVHSAGRQVRCQPGRGHADWSAGFCV